MQNSINNRKILHELLRTPTLWISALGYFVDLYDLVLFGVVRVPSLKALGVMDSEIFSTGAFLLNCQMAGLLFGGLGWGLLADKYGRLKALFASIILYSAANFLNAFVANIPQYAALRFLAGLGLAGELGIAVTLVSESVSKYHRGYASAVIAFAGFLGAIVAATTSSLVAWPVAYMVGGGLGFLLLIARIRIRESPLFQKASDGLTHRNRLRLIFLDKKKAMRFFLVTASGFPIWYTAGILIYFSPELARESGVQGPISAGTAIMISYIGSLLGDVVAGVLSQALQSRKKILLLGLVMTGVIAGIDLFFTKNWTSFSYYILIFMLGLANGYWALYVTFAAEQFGTNVRATVTTSIPNIVRAAVIPLTTAIQLMRGSLGFLPAVATVGIATLALSMWALAQTQETFHAELDFIEKS